MEHADGFSACHPVVGFSFFTLVVLFSMSVMHPLWLLISLCCGIAYSLRLNGKKSVLASMRVLLPMMLLAVIVNAAFNHRGVTILTYLPSGNPLTLESVLYGISAAGMLLAVLEWFSCASVVLTSDKFIFLFGRILPALSLLLSMALRFVPRFSSQLRQVREARLGAGLVSETDKGMRRLRSGIAAFSAVVTWALENAIETSDSMKARGYGLPGRSAFSVFRFDGRDRLLMLWMGIAGVYLLCGWAAGAMRFSYYPIIETGLPTLFSAGFPLVYLALCLTPLILDEAEERMWKHMRSEI